MPDEIFSLAVIEAFPHKEDALLKTLRELYTMMGAKGYCHDWLFRDAARPDRLLHLRRWASAETRAEAQADPEVHRYWLMLPELCTVTVTQESMEKVFETK